MNKQEIKKLLIAVGAGLAGYPLNFLYIELFFGVNIIFGGILPMVIVLSYGRWHGALAALLSGTATLVLWGHPYALIIFTLEAFIVGMLKNRSREGVFGADLLFWLLLGMPLVYLSYHHILSLPVTSTLLIAFKQGSNAVFNLAVAAGLLLLKPVRRQLFFEDFSLPSLSEYINVVLILSMSVILFGVTAVEGSRSYAALNSAARTNLSRSGQQIRNFLLEFLSERYWELHLEIQEIQSELGSSSIQFSADNQQVEARIRTSIYFSEYALLDEQGQILWRSNASAPYPLRKALDSANAPITLGAKHSVLERNRWVELTAEPAFAARWALMQPIELNVHGWKGTLLGLLDNDALEEVVGSSRHFLSNPDMRFEFTSSGRQRLHPNGGISHMASDADQGNLENLGEDFYLQFPGKNLPTMVRWGDSAMIYRMEIPRLNSVLYLSQPLLNAQIRLQEKYLEIFLFLFAMLASLLMVTFLGSAFVNKELKLLLSYTRSIQENITSGAQMKTIRHPIIRELDALYVDVHNLDATIHQLFGEVREHSENLERTLGELRLTQTKLEVQASQNGRIEAYRDFVHTVGNLITPVRVKASNILNDSNIPDYLNQLTERTRLLGKKLKQEQLQDYLEGEGKQDFPNFEKGLQLINRLYKENREELNTIYTALNRVIETTMAQSRLQKELSVTEKVDLKLVIEGIINLLEENWEQKGIHWTLEMVNKADGDHSEALLQVEKVRLFNMIHNVFKNSGEAFETPGENGKFIRIMLDSSQNDLTLTVKDNGKGLSAEEMKQVGKIGFTTKHDSETGEGGSGLGIHNCQIFMGRIGGRFELQSEGQGKGTTVEITFPEEVRA